MTTAPAVERLINLTVDAILAVDPMDLPLGGRHWTLRITDEVILLRIQAADRRVNGEPFERRPPPEPTPQPRPQDPPKSDPPPDSGGQR